MDMSIVEKKKVLKVRNERRKNVAFTIAIAKVIVSFIALSAIINSDLNVAKNPSIGSFFVSVGVCGILFASVLRFVNDNK